MLHLGDGVAWGHMREATLHRVGARHRVQPRMKQEKMVIQLESKAHSTPSWSHMRKALVAVVLYITTYFGQTFAVTGSKYQAGKG